MHAHAGLNVALPTCGIIILCMLPNINIKGAMRKGILSIISIYTITKSVSMAAALPEGSFSLPPLYTFLSDIPSGPTT